MSIIEMRVSVDCAGCEGEIRKALKHVRGVDSVDVDLHLQKVTVMGSADRRKVFKAIRRTGKNVQMWPYPYNPQSYGYYQQPTGTHNEPVSFYSQPAAAAAAETATVTSFYSKSTGSKSNYARGKPKRKIKFFHNIPQDEEYTTNYFYDRDHYGYYQKPMYATMIDEQASSAFSDDNPHACAIM